MARLIATTPCGDLLPAAGAGVVLTEVPPAPAYSVAPFKGKQKACAAALKKASGLALPGPNGVSMGEGARALWFGHGRYLLGGVDAPAVFDGIAAVTDQSDAWAAVRIEGASARTVLARVTPIDLRDASMPQGTTARSMIGHMSASITRTGPDRYEAMVMRSMAATLVHELTEAMDVLAARAAAGTGLGA